MRLGGKLVTVGGCLSPPRPTRGPTRRGGTRRVLVWFRTPILLGPCFKGSAGTAASLCHAGTRVAFRVRQVFRRLEIPGCISYPHEWTCILAVPGMRLVSPSPCWPPHPRVWRPWTYQARMPLGPIRGALTPAQSCGRVMQPSTRFDDQPEVLGQDLRDGHRHGTLDRVPELPLHAQLFLGNGT